LTAIIGAPVFAYLLRRNKRGRQKPDPEEFYIAVAQVGFRKFEIIQNDSGFWIYFECKHELKI